VPRFSLLSLALAMFSACDGAPLGAEPYRLYPALDLARVPFHAADGPWGSRRPIAAPESPNVMRSVQVATVEEFQAAALVPGTEVIVTSSIEDHLVIFGDAIDVDIVVPEGITLGPVTVGRFEPPSRTERVRFRGTTAGEHTGGTIGLITFGSTPTSDVIIDGVDLNGANDPYPAQMLWYFATRVERAAIINVRGHSVASAALFSGGVDIVIAGSNLLTGQRPREVNGHPEAWGLRGADRSIVFQSRIDGTRYHRVRVHPREGDEQYLWLAENVFVDPHEARIASAFDLNGGDAEIDGFWAEGNRVHAYTECLTPSLEASAGYARVTGNELFGSYTAELHQLQQNMGGDRDYITGNVYSPWRDPPGWESPGDPSEIPLPPIDENAYDASLMGEPCPGP
jgi:hypothetical protein